MEAIVEKAALDGDTEKIALNFGKHQINLVEEGKSERLGMSMRKFVATSPNSTWEVAEKQLPYRKVRVGRTQMKCERD